MPKFIIKWDIGYGQNASVIECSTQIEAEEAAYANAKEEFESQAEYSAEPYTKEEAVALDIEDEEEDA
jgi:hypothetical protein